MLDTKAYAVVGRPKSGKTFWTKRQVIALGNPALVWDINAEWGQDAPNETVFVDRVEKLKRATIVWEEATSFLGHPSAKVVQRATGLISRRRHTETTHFLLFTSLRAVPTRIMDNLDRIILFPTNDNPALIASKFRGWPDVLQAVEKQRENPVIIPHPTRILYEPIDIHIFGA